MKKSKQVASLRQRDTDAYSSGSICTWPNRSILASGFCNARRIFLRETRQPSLVTPTSLFPIRPRRQQQDRKTFSTWRAFVRHLLTRIRRQSFVLTPGERRWDLTFGSG